jgi:hypothetical protein
MMMMMMMMIVLKSFGFGEILCAQFQFSKGVLDLGTNLSPGVC